MYRVVLFFFPTDGSHMHTVGEVILPQLLRSKVPVPVAAATSTGTDTRPIPLPLPSLLLAFEPDD